MTSLLSLPVYLIIGLVEWYLALRRTLACARGEKKTLVVIVFIENLLSLAVLQNFIENHDFTIAVAYSIGSACGALMVTINNKEKN